MRTLRLLAVGSVFAVSLLTIGLVCVDRLAHPAPVRLPAMVQAPLRDPAATGSLAPAAAPVAVKPKATDGFDTERLNALMRGDPIAGPPRRN